MSLEWLHVEDFLIAVLIQGVLRLLHYRSQQGLIPRRALAELQSQQELIIRTTSATIQSQQDLVTRRESTRNRSQQIQTLLRRLMSSQRRYRLCTARQSQREMRLQRRRRAVELVRSLVGEHIPHIIQLIQSSQLQIEITSNQLQNLNLLSFLFPSATTLLVPPNSQNSITTRNQLSLMVISQSELSSGLRSVLQRLFPRPERMFLFSNEILLEQKAEFELQLLIMMRKVWTILKTFPTRSIIRN